MSIYRLYRGALAAQERRQSEAARTQAFLAVAARMTRKTEARRTSNLVDPQQNRHYATTSQPLEEDDG